MLTSYPATLLNRDDSGLAKRLPFGEASRTRISSQCLKSHWRHAEREYGHEYAITHVPKLEPVDFGIRSRKLFERIADDLVKEGLAPDKGRCPA